MRRNLSEIPRRLWQLLDAAFGAVRTFLDAVPERFVRILCRSGGYSLFEFREHRGVHLLLRTPSAESLWIHFVVGFHFLSRGSKLDVSPAYLSSSWWLPCLRYLSELGSSQD